MILSIGAKNLIITYKIQLRKKIFYPYEHLSDFEKFKKQLPSKEKFNSFLISKKISGKEYKHVLKV